MRRTVLAVAFGLAGCMTGETVDSTQSSIVEGNWVLAPSVSDLPIQAAEVPPGVEATPVDLVMTSDGILLACNNGVPMGGYGSTDGDDGDGGGQMPGLRPVEENAPVRTDTSDDTADDQGPHASGDIIDSTYEEDQPLAGRDLESELPLPEGMWLFHAGCL